MIPQNWQTELKKSSRNSDDILQTLGLQPSQFDLPLAKNPEFKIKVTDSFLAKIKAKNPHDPLLLQILAFSDIESDNTFTSDPTGEQTKSVTPALIKKYPGRALLICTQACPIHCRFCFRQHFPYQSHNHLQQAFDAIKADTSISEIILSGGDPLSLSNENLATIFNRLSSISHVQTIRIHSRFSSVLPARFDCGLVSLLTNATCAIVLVNHINHPNEIDQTVIDKLKQIKGSITLLNQSVLLRGINDDADTQIALAHQLFKAGILPYYLHLLDKTKNTAYFYVSINEAKSIIRAMRASLPGYLVPKLVADLPDQPSKTLLE